MLPMTIQCNTCGEFIYRGKKFNARKETVLNENYLGIRIFRFYVKCNACSAELVFKTDPKNSDYIAEVGCTRNFEPWQQVKTAEAELKNEKDLAEKDVMKKLENRTQSSKNEMEVLDALEEMMEMNQRQAAPDTKLLIAQANARHAREALNNELVRVVFTLDCFCLFLSSFVLRVFVLSAFCLIGWFLGNVFC